MRCSKILRIWAKRVLGEKRERRPSGGSNMRTAPTCKWLVPPSRARKAASIPSIGSTGPPSPAGWAASSSPPAVTEPARPSISGGQIFEGQRLELGPGHLLDDQLGDAIAPLHQVVLRRISVDQQHRQLTPV